MRPFRCFRFRLRTLLALVTLAAFPLSYYAYNSRQYAANMAALGQLKATCYHQGWVTFDDEPMMWNGTAPGVIATISWQGPEWLRAPLKAWGAPIFYRVTALELQLDVFNDASIATIATLRNLNKLTLSQTAISPAPRCDQA